MLPGIRHVLVFFPAVLALVISDWPTTIFTAILAEVIECFETASEVQMPRAIVDFAHS